LTTGSIAESMIDMSRMSLKKFGQIVAGVMKTLPDELKPYLDNVVVDVRDEPDRKTLLAAGLTAQEIADGETILGLFDPLALPTEFSGDAVDTGAMLHRLIIFKRPLEDEFPDEHELLAEIRKTVIHELAHHFGYTDRDLERWTTVY
jgi:predicted Zn-dependent protease with MMP-like domain